MVVLYWRHTSDHSLSVEGNTSCLHFMNVFWSLTRSCCWIFADSISDIYLVVFFSCICLAFCVYCVCVYVCCVILWGGISFGVHTCYFTDFELFSCYFVIVVDRSGRQLKWRVNVAQRSFTVSWSFLYWQLFGLGIFWNMDEFDKLFSCILCLTVYYV